MEKYTVTLPISHELFWLSIKGLWEFYLWSDFRLAFVKIHIEKVIKVVSIESSEQYKRTADESSVMATTSRRLLASWQSPYITSVDIDSQ